MEHLFRILIRMVILLVNPLILGGCFYLIYRRKAYREVIQTHKKELLRNTFLVIVGLSIGIFLFYRIEDTIYTYDYAWHWIRSLTYRQMFFEEPSAIFPHLFQSLRMDDYTYLPALFTLPFTILNTSYGFYCLSIILLFLTPTFFFLQVWYFQYYKDSWIPVFIGLLFYPLYIIAFYGEVDLGGWLFLIVIYLLAFQEDVDKISLLSINGLTFFLLFFRRWYLYAVVAFYLVFLISLWKKKTDKKEALLSWLLSWGILAVVILVCFRPYVIRIFTNQFAEEFGYNNKGRKLFSFLDFYSPFFLALGFIGVYQLIKEKNWNHLVACLFLVVFPTALFWQIQSYEFHHYCIITIALLDLITIGIHQCANWSKKITYPTILLLGFLQLFLIFTPTSIKIPILTTETKKVPYQLSYKKELQEFTYHLRQISGEGQYFYLASGSPILSDDMIRNSILPDLNVPNIDTSVLDLRDGFPRKLSQMSFVITTNPIQYSDENYQHSFTIISNAIWKEPLIQSIYQPIYSTTIHDLEVTVYQKTGEFTPEIRQYFYNQIISYYPDKEEFFSYILEE